MGTNALTGIRTFIFDCFGVLCTPILSNWYKANSTKLGFVDDNFQKLLRQFDLGELSEDDIFEHFGQYKGIQISKEDLREEIDSALQLDESLVGIIKGLRAKGFRIALLSNANNAFFERKIYPTFPEFKGLFDELIISSVVGMVKPDSNIFLHTLRVMDSKPEESLFVDDAKRNVDAAIALGMHGFLYQNSTSFAEHIAKLGIDLHT